MVNRQDWVRHFPTFRSAGSWISELPWMLWLSWGSFLLALILPITIWATTLLGMVTVFPPGVPDSEKIFDSVSQIEILRIVLNVGFPLGLLSLIITIIRPPLPHGKRIFPLILIAFVFVSASFTAAAFWQCLNWIHGEEWKLWSEVWWTFSREHR